MAFVKFMFKGAGANRVRTFPAQPTWEQLASTIAPLFKIPTDNIDVVGVSKDGETIALSNEEDLQGFFEVADQSLEIIKLVVRDLRESHRKCIPLPHSILAQCFVRFPAHAIPIDISSSHLLPRPASHCVILYPALISLPASLLIPIISRTPFSFVGGFKSILHR
jgi:hypothetical protein